MSAFGAHSGTLNQELSIVGVVGTLGTADEGGTAQVLPFGVNPATGAAYVDILAGTATLIGGTNVNIVSGTINVGTVVTNEVETTGFNGGTVSVGTAAVELTFTGVTQSIMVTADHNNGTMIYVGPSSVAQDGSNAVTRLDPGETLSVDLNDAAAPLYAVAGTTSQKVYKVALT